MLLLRIGLVSLGATLFATAWAAWRRRQLPYFPIQLSKTANEAPSIFIFRVGLTLSAAFLFFSLPGPAGRLASVLLPLIGLFSDRCFPRLHTSIAAVVFGLMSLQCVLALGLNCAAWTAALSQCLNAVLFAPIAFEYDHLCPFALGRRLAWSIAVRDSVWNLAIKRVRGVLQWITIASLGWNLWSL